VKNANEFRGLVERRDHSERFLSKESAKSTDRSGHKQCFKNSSLILKSTKSSK